MAKVHRRAPLPKFTAKNLLEAFGAFESRAGRMFSPKMAMVIANMSQFTHKDIDRILSAVNKAIGAHGIEAIRSESAWDNYYGDSVALYVNTGDTYSASVVYDIGKDEWVEPILHALIPPPGKASTP